MVKFLKPDPAIRSLHRPQGRHRQGLRRPRLRPLPGRRHQEVPQQGDLKGLGEEVDGEAVREARGSLKKVVTPDVLTSKDKKVTALKETKKRFGERFKTGKNMWFFTKLRLLLSVADPGFKDGVGSNFGQRANIFFQYNHVKLEAEGRRQVVAIREDRRRSGRRRLWWSRGGLKGSGGGAAEGKRDSQIVEPNDDGLDELFVYGNQVPDMGESQMTSVVAKGTKPPPKKKNELRAKAAKIREDAKNKREEKKAAARAACKVAPTRRRPPKVAANNGGAASSKEKASSAPQTSQSSQASTRSYVRNKGSARNTRK
ncbi:hypothetical protein ACLB2K_069239 [Fragaria x ananassa]